MSLLGAGRIHALAFFALLPQFVLFSGFVSNDSLSFLLGTASIVVALDLIERPTRRNVGNLAVLTGLGLATKGTAIAFAGLFGLLVVVIRLRHRQGARELFVRAALFGAITLFLGGYKHPRRLGQVRPPSCSAASPGTEAAEAGSSTKSTRRRRSAPGGRPKGRPRGRSERPRRELLGEGEGIEVVEFGRDDVGILPPDADRGGPGDGIEMVISADDEEEDEGGQREEDADADAEGIEVPPAASAARLPPD